MKVGIVYTTDFFLNNQSFILLFRQDVNILLQSITVILAQGILFCIVSSQTFVLPEHFWRVRRDCSAIRADCRRITNN